MYVCCTFQHSLNLELMLRDIEKIAGKGAEDLFIVPLDLQQTETVQTIRLIRGDEPGKYDGALILATIGMLLGIIYGMILYWGPVIWALIGLIGGASAGYAASRIYKRFRNGKPTAMQNMKETGETFVMIRCEKEELETVKAAILQFSPVGFAVVPIE